MLVPAIQHYLLHIQHEMHSHFTQTLAIMNCNSEAQAASKSYQPKTKFLSKVHLYRRYSREAVPFCELKRSFQVDYFITFHPSLSFLACSWHFKCTIARSSVHFAKSQAPFLVPVLKKSLPWITRFSWEFFSGRAVGIYDKQFYCEILLLLWRNFMIPTLQF